MIAVSIKNVVKCKTNADTINNLDLVKYQLLIYIRAALKNVTVSKQHF